IRIFQLMMVIPWNDIFQPFNPAIIYEIAGITVLLCLTGIMSSAEVALFSISHQQMDRMERDGDATDRLIIDFINKPRRLLATILLAITLFSLSIVLLFESLIELSIREEFLRTYPTIEFLFKVSFETFIIVLFAEVIPKIYASQHNIKVARMLIKPIQFFSTLFSPFAKMLMATSNFFEKRLEKANKGVSAKDIDQAIDITTSQDNTDTERNDTRILKGIVKFGNITVSQIMHSRMEMVAVDHDATFPELLHIVRESGYSRIPVYEDDIDKIIGVLYVKDLLKYIDAADDFRWLDLIKPAFFVPENKKIDDLLEDFQTKRVHMAIVVDEYGGSSGIVTLEDVLEEVIGDIKDEFDDASEIDYKKIDNHNFIFEGRTALNDVCKVLEIPADAFDEVRGDADSLAGLILEMTAEIPVEGDELKFENYTFLILEADKTRIIRVKVTIGN
ncbi:MAG TPA: gliding motility-associated protein GldE, partial [Chitinophagales bacterium]|nr:gliding motility-associated protein GldE [Chitinophagales bacterium]